MICFLFDKALTSIVRPEFCSIAETRKRPKVSFDESQTGASLARRCNESDKLPTEVEKRKTSRPNELKFGRVESTGNEVETGSM